MTNYLDLFTKLRAPLEQVPLGPYAALCLSLWAVAAIVRRFRPQWWSWLLRVWPGDPESLQAHLFQALPTTVLGGLFAGVTTGSLEGAAFGALSGLFSPLVHHVAKVAPGPYSGSLRDKARQWEKAERARLGLLFLGLFGCTEPRHPERNDCYLEADRIAAQDYLTECADYPDTRVCPHGDAIEERHGKSLKECP